MADQQKYTNKVANTRCLVIGGTSGIGFAVAEALVEHGATVTVSSSNPERVERAVARLQQAYPSKKANVSGTPCDLSGEATVEANVQALLDTVTGNKTTKLDHIVHTAGDGLRARSLATATMESIKEGAMVRFFSVIFLAKHAAAYMSPGPNASITLTTGSVSERPLPNWAIGGAFGAGMHGLTRGFALDLAPLRVNLISPGAVKTELWDSLPQEVVTKYLDGFTAKMPTGQIGKPEDVAEAYMYAIRDRNLTGTVISTNGGSLLTS